MEKAINQTLTYQYFSDFMNKGQLIYEIYLLDDKAIVIFQITNGLDLSRNLLNELLIRGANHILNTLLYDYANSNIVWIISYTNDDAVTHKTKVFEEEGLYLIRMKEVDNRYVKAKFYLISKNFDAMEDNLEKLNTIYNNQKDKSDFMDKQFNSIIYSALSSKKESKLLTPKNITTQALRKKTLVKRIAREFKEQGCRVYKNIYVISDNGEMAGTKIKVDLMVVAHNDIIYCNVLDGGDLDYLPENQNDMVKFLKKAKDSNYLSDVYNSIKITEDLLDEVMEGDHSYIHISNLTVLKNGKSVSMKFGNMDSQDLDIIFENDSKLLGYKEQIADMDLEIPSKTFRVFLKHMKEYFESLYRDYNNSK
jgi:hypothetical protein